MSDRTVWTLTPAPRAARRARKLMAEWCHQNAVPAATRDDAPLVTSELVTNATKHALGAEELTISVTLNQATLRIAVADDGTGQPHIGPRLTDSSTDGRGLPIVGHLTQAWDVRQSVTEKVV